MKTLRKFRTGIEKRENGPLFAIKQNVRFSSFFSEMSDSLFYIFSCLQAYYFSVSELSQVYYQFTTPLLLLGTAHKCAPPGSRQSSLVVRTYTCSTIHCIRNIVAVQWVRSSTLLVAKTGAKMRSLTKASTVVGLELQERENLVVRRETKFS